jgi:hypothetical protein
MRWTRTRRGAARLAHWHETGTEVISERGSENESACFNTNYNVDLCVLILGGKRIDSSLQSVGMFEKRGDVVKVDTGFGEVGTSLINCLDCSYTVVGVYGLWSLFLSARRAVLIVARCARHKSKAKIKNQRPILYLSIRNEEYNSTAQEPVLQPE